MTKNNELTHIGIPPKKIIKKIICGLKLFCKLHSSSANKFQSCNVSHKYSYQNKAGGIHFAWFALLLTNPGPMSITLTF